MKGIDIYQAIVRETERIFYGFEQPASIDGFCEPTYPEYLRRAIGALPDTIKEAMRELKGQEHFQIELGPACSSMLGVTPKFGLSLWKVTKCYAAGGKKRVRGRLSYKYNGREKDLAYFCVRKVPKDL